MIRVDNWASSGLRSDRMSVFNALGDGIGMVLVDLLLGSRIARFTQLNGTVSAWFNEAGKYRRQAGRLPPAHA
ncbi:MAG: hypothetical protein ACQEVT_09435 [Pseudomonadota bacterium]|uniref:hypothetical protein n=2 Tax=Roseovarius TaxID=74030 RepID=UPI0022A80EFB|nr:hypothetical protein [Roseovarius sp. EGI FJ00037]MCZ0812964.1 hypothetical protein [Roseovarius sp. EGI FJ00037]